MTPDVNVLVAASREEHVHHATARRWLEQASAQSANAGLGISHPSTSLCVITGVMASFIRLVTNARVFATPTPTQTAIAFLDAVLESPGVTLLDTSSNWLALRQLCLTKNLNANAIPDALIAAAVLQSREVLATFDRDFLRLLPARQVQLLTA